MDLAIARKAVGDIANHITRDLGNHFSPGLVFEMVGIDIDDQPIVKPAFIALALCAGQRLSGI